MLYQQRSEFPNDTAARAGSGVCAWCGAVHFAKAWHHPDAVRRRLGKTLRSAWLGRCPACEMIAEGRHGGEIILTGIPPELGPQLTRLIRPFMRRAYERNCQHRLIAMHHESNSTWRVTLTEKQMANGLSRRIRDTFKDAKPKVSFVHGPGNVRSVRIAFHPVPAQRVVDETHSRLASIITAVNGLATAA